MILAAGAGRRYGGLKQLAPVGPVGETLLEYAAFDALRAGFGRAVVVVRPDTERTVRDRLEPGMARHLPVAYVHQRLDDVPAGVEAGGRTRPWGTGHAVLAAEPEIDAPFAVVNADDFYGAESYAAIHAFLAAGGDRLAAVGFRAADTLAPDSGPVSRARLESDRRRRLRRIVEIYQVCRRRGGLEYRDGEDRRHTLGDDELVSMNLWGFVPRVLPELRRRFADFLSRPEDVAGGEFLLSETVQTMIACGAFEVEVLAASSEWCGITHAADQRWVRSFLASRIEAGRYPRELWGEENKCVTKSR